MRKRLILVFLLLAFTQSILAQTVPDIPTLPGQIAYIGTDHNVHVIVSDGDLLSRIQLTTDARNDRRYQWVTWANDGRLAYFCCDSRFMRAVDLRLEAYIASDPAQSSTGKLIYNAPNEVITYAYWSPQNCDDNTGCRDLAMLVGQGANPFKLELIRDAGAQTTTRTAGTGVPFYFSWSPDGQSMAWQRNNRAFSIYSLGDNSISTPLRARPGLMQAPQWSPTRDEFLVAVANASGTSDIVLVAPSDPEPVRLVQTNLDGVVSLSWSPDGQKIAYSVLNRDGQSALFVLDADNGETLAAYQTSFLIAFFWSPDSERIAFLTPAGLGGNLGVSRIPVQGRQLRLAWSVMEVENIAIRTFTGWTPTDEMLYLITYFDQFSQSHRLWSPDSRYLLYGESTDNIRAVLTILDTHAVGQVTYPVGDGLIGIWSFD